MKAIQILSLCFLCLSNYNCKPEPKIEDICFNSSLQTHEYLENLTGVNFLTDFEEALECASFSGRPILISFCANPPSGIRETINKSYLSQLNYLLESNETKKTIKENYISLILFVDDQTEINPDHYTSLLKRVEKYFELYNPLLISNLHKSNRTMGSINQKLQIALLGSNELPSFVILDSQGDRIEGKENVGLSDFQTMLEQVQIFK